MENLHFNPEPQKIKISPAQNLAKMAEFAESLRQNQKPDYKNTPAPEPRQSSSEKTLFKSTLDQYTQEIKTHGHVVSSVSQPNGETVKKLRRDKWLKERYNHQKP